jgi:hypothetical protein
MQHELWSRVAFAAKLKRVDEAPEPLRSAMLETLRPHDTVHRLIFGPVQKVPDKVWPANLLAILDRAWIAVICGEDGLPQVRRCDYADTLLIEMTDILLYGRLQLDYLAARQPRTVAVHFNTVTGELYQEAVKLLLCAMGDASPARPHNRSDAYAALEVLPLKFQNAIVRYLPFGERILTFIHWPPALRRRLKIVRYEAVPEGVLVLTNRHLLFISEEEAWWGGRSRRHAKYGYIVTYCPLSRVTAIRISERGSYGVLSVYVGVRRLAERWDINFPREQRAAMTAFGDQVTSSPALQPSNPGIFLLDSN